MPPGREKTMPRMYYSEENHLYACWHDNSFFLIVGPNPNGWELFSKIFYSENAVKKYLEENGYKKL